MTQIGLKSLARTGHHKLMDVALTARRLSIDDCQPSHKGDTCRESVQPVELSLDNFLYLKPSSVQTKTVTMLHNITDKSFSKINILTPNLIETDIATWVVAL